MTSQAGKPTGQLPNPYTATGQGANASVTPSANGTPSNAEGPAKEPKKKNMYIPQQVNTNRNRPQAAKNQSRSALPAVPAISARSSATGTAPSVGQSNIEYFKSTAEDDAANMEDMAQRRAEERQRQKEQRKNVKQFGPWHPDNQYTGKSWTNQKAYIGRGQWRFHMSEWDALMRKTKNETPHLSIPSKAESDSSVIVANLGSLPDGFKEFEAGCQSDLITLLPAYQPGQNVDEFRARVAQGIDEYGAFVSQTTPPPPSGATPAPYSAKFEAPPKYFMTVTAPGLRNDSAPYKATYEAPPTLYSPINAQKHRGSELQGQPSKKQKTATATEPELSIAERMMRNMGHIKGQGLGKNNQGITAPLSVRMDRKRDAESSAPQTWTITGGNRAVKEEPGKFGELSHVIVTWGCVDGVDWATDAERNDGGIRQEMGDYFNKQFGTVERVYVNMTGSPQAVYVKFNNGMSALQAVTKFDKGFQFEDKNVRARFYDEAKFNANDFDY